YQLVVVLVIDPLIMLDPATPQNPERMNAYQLRGCEARATLGIATATIVSPLPNPCGKPGVRVRSFSQRLSSTEHCIGQFHLPPPNLSVTFLPNEGSTSALGCAPRKFPFAPTLS